MKRPTDNAPTPKKKGGCLKIVLIAIVALFVIGVIGSLSEKEEKSKTEKKATKNIEETDEKPQPNTSDMVDYIAKEAKKSANKAATEEKRNEAIEYIYNNYPNYYTDNETMERTMYYGYYLEYAYAKNGSTNLYANLGMDTYQSVKYVYRGTATIEETSIQENLKQIKDALIELGYNF